MTENTLALQLCANSMKRFGAQYKKTAAIYDGDLHTAAECDIDLKRFAAERHALVEKSAALRKLLAEVLANAVE